MMRPYTHPTSVAYLREHSDEEHRWDHLKLWGLRWVLHVWGGRNDVKRGHVGWGDPMSAKR